MRTVQDIKEAKQIVRKKAWGRLLGACLMAGALTVPTAGLAAPGRSVRVDPEHFPDDVFRAFVARYDKDEDDVLSLAERLAVRRMDLGEREVASLKGIGYFGNLEVLRSDDASRLREADLRALNALQVLDLPGAALEELEAPGLSLISVHGAAQEADLSEQKPAVIALADGEDSFDLAELDPRFEEGTVRDLAGGASLDGTVLTGLEPGQRITYTYTGGGLTAHCVLDVRRANAWTEEPDMESWADGDEAPSPAGEAEHGEVLFFYGAEGVPFSEKVPTAPGSYVMRAVVAPDDEYAGLTADVPFSVMPGENPRAAEDAPSLIEATYGEKLSDLDLPAGYAWRDPDLYVGAVGINPFQATYRAPDGTTETVSINVRVLPRNGATLDISPITDEYEANHIVIRDGDVTLIKGTDYIVTNSVQADVVTVTIHFMGNYTGDVVRQFTFDLENAWIIPLTAPGWTYGQTPRLPQAEARYGTTSYTYAPVTDSTTGEFTTTVPEAAGTYVVRAVVPSTIYYTGLSSEEQFVIAKADPDFELPQGVAAYYTTLLQAIPLPTGFSFQNPNQAVGAVGEHSFEGLYTPEDTANYNTVPVQIQVTVLPKNGSNFQVDQITTEAQAENPVVRDGNTVLVKNVDYTVSIQRSGTQLTLTINFIGNYTGQLVRTYAITQSGSGGGTTLTSAPGTNDETALGWHIAGLITSGGVAAGAAWLLLRKKGFGWKQRSRS